jgi:cell wall-associated NlpC family hydrolase
MPPRFRSRLLVLALVALVFGCAVQTAAAKLPGPPRRHLAPKKPTLGQRAARIALREVGVPYSYGGASPSSGFDCSGLVYWAYRRLGVTVPHSSYALVGIGRGVPRSRLRAGDILVFSGLGHVGLYVGRGRMVHAPQTGRNVEIVSLRGSNYGMRLVAARRLVR